MIKIIKTEMAKTETMFEVTYTYENGVRVTITTPTLAMETQGIEKPKDELKISDFFNGKISEKDQ